MHDLFVVTAPGLEDITAAEMAALGHPPDAREPGGLSLAGDVDALWRLNMGLRTASRVLVRVAEFRAVGFGELERRGRKVPWRSFLAPGIPPDEVVFDVTCRKSRLYHSGAVEARLREALAEAVSGSGPGASGRPSPGDAATGAEDPPPARFVVRLVRNRLLLSADASGEHLHRRGYRQAVARAPLRETLAAALLLAGEWDGKVPLVDPFCGAGTIPIEAAMMVLGILPGARRRFAFETWAGVDPERGHALRTAATPGGEPRDVPLILASDRDAGAVEASLANARRAGVDQWIHVARAAVSQAQLPGTPGLLVTNPPYGARVGDTSTLRNLYARLGTRLREEWSGGRVVLLSAEPALARQLELETRVLFRTLNGGIPVEVLEARIP